MNERSKKISKLLHDFDARRAYIKATLGILVPSKIRALRLKSNMPRQSDLAAEARMHQSRISMFETPGEANVTLETLAKLAAAFKVGLKVEFVPFSDMLRWENDYSQDAFDVTRIEEDLDFRYPVAERPSNDAKAMEEMQQFASALEHPPGPALSLSSEKQAAAGGA
jgi:transcriptional regulator with XRE-family HTH domain